MSLRIVFMGTPAFSVPTLSALADAGHEVAAVYSQPPRPAGRRGLAPTPSPVAVEAERLGAEVRTPVSLKSAEEQAAFAALKSDIAIVVAYGLLLPQAVLDAPRHGALNGHASLLPRWRGAAPIQRAIEARDVATGVMVMRMEAGLDTGPVALTMETTIGPQDTAGDLHERLSALCAQGVVEALARLEAGTLAFEAQDAIAARTGRETVYARKIDKGETAVDFTLPAADVAARINAFSPFPGAWTMIDFGAGPERVKLLRALPIAGDGAPGRLLDEGLTIACADGAVQIREAQRAGGKAMAADILLRGASPVAGSFAGAR
ncbi:methionyl-tRNA formyltransferase [Aureimonas mangrovi]|uniref:methionyl-tRNA formyltransferase n=1 Tax=Aureimonas mangrovi TaxID=2758041 RepID=UPI00163D8FD6|nr:methionyl-tRNA formyltransferase [Aureimonas mangrovi]